MNTNVELNLPARELKLLGKARVKLKLSVRRKCVLDLYEVKIGNNPFFGCEWLKALPVDLKRSTSQRTGFAPSELILGRTIKTKLDLLKPDVDRETVIKQRKFFENRMKEVLGLLLAKKILQKIIGAK